MSHEWLVEAACAGAPDEPGPPPIELRALSSVDAWALVAKTFGISGAELAERVAARFRLALADLDSADPRAARLVPERFARRHEIFPLRERGRSLLVATCNPTDHDTEHALAFASGLTPSFAVATPEAIQGAIKNGYARGKPATRLVESLLSGMGDDRIDVVLDQVRVLAEEKPQEDADERDVDETPVIRLVNLILLDAVQRRASDIHVGPGPGGGAVRLRVDGVLQDYMQMPSAALNRVVSRIKILGDLDITDRLRPQDGHARILVNDQAYDLRISTVPTRDSENAVIRMLDPRGARRFRDLDFTDPERERFRRLLAHRDGVVVVTGPTGSGKTTTLYAAIRELANGEVNVMTVEDPIEYELPGVTQIQVEPERMVTFASALRAILRQDPDVILVGEIRDLETAQIAVQAASTGHLVLATLHTNNALGIIARLADLGLEPFMIESVIRGALGQRLVRRLCFHCAVAIGPDEALTAGEAALAERYGTRPVARAVGCPECLTTGYRGRFPIAEVFLMDYRLAELIARGSGPLELERAAIEGGMRRMVVVALERVAQGDTTLEEVARVLGQAAEEAPGGARSTAPITPAFADMDPEIEPVPGVEAAPHILVVDDDPMTRRFVRALLEHHDYRVSEARNGSSALELLRSGSYSLVLLDLNMPKLSGGEVLSVLRSEDRTAELPVVVLTAANGPSEVNLLNQGADDFVAKPIVPDRLIARVRANLRRAGSSRGR